MQRYCLYWLVLVILTACKAEIQPHSGMDVMSVLSTEDTEGFSKAYEKREFHFPQDHGAHPEFKNEWWYLTGNLTDLQGRKFGYQVTFFRLGINSSSSERQSAWVLQNLWMAHAAVTDVKGRQHHHAERFSRANPGMAGASWKPFKVWLDDWQLAALKDEFPWQVKVKTDVFEFEFALTAEKNIVLQGEEGLSRKSETPGNASYYYSLTRMKTTGRLSLNQQTFKLEGLSWLDREWGTSSLDQDQIGWDWFSLQLNSGDDVMYYQLRDKNAQSHPNSQGIWVNNKSETRIINPSDLNLTPLDWWQSEQGERFPVRWHLEYKPARKNWIISALLEDQKMNVSIPYWEGAVSVTDFESGSYLGSGYLEMTGY